VWCGFRRVGSRTGLNIERGITYSYGGWSYLL